MIWFDVDTVLAEVPINISALIDDTNFKAREEGLVYNQGGLDLVWNFVTTGGAYTQTAVTPTDGGDYAWGNQGNGMYTVAMTATGGASADNDTEGFGWFTGFATGVLPWTGPVQGFRAAGLNNLLVDSAAGLDNLVLDGLKDAGIILARCVIETVTSQTEFVLTTAVDSQTNDTLIGALAVFIDADDPNTRSMALVTDYAQSSRKVTVAPAPDFTVTTADTIVILALSTARTIWDRLITGATHNIPTSAGRRLRGLGEFGGYMGGAVWIDTIKGSAGTSVNDNGISTAPVDNIGDANDLAEDAELQIIRFEVAPHSEIEFAEGQDNDLFYGKHWTLALGGQSISNTIIQGADVSGTGTGASQPHFDDCEINAVTLPACHIHNSMLRNTLTVSATGTYHFINLKCMTAAVVDFVSGVGSTTIIIDDFSGNLEVKNMATGDVLFIEGTGKLTVNANCTGGTIYIRGAIEVVNNGAVTIDRDTTLDRIEQKTSEGYPAANIFYIDPTDGNDSTGDGTSENPIKSWWGAFNSSSGVAYAKKDEPVLVYFLAQEAHGTAIDMDNIAGTPLGCAVQQPNVRIIGVGYPYLDNTRAAECTVTFAATADNCEMSGFRIGHQNGNGIHVQGCNDVKIHDIIYGGDCDSGGAVVLENCVRSFAWNIRDMADVANPSNAVIIFDGCSKCGAWDIQSTIAYYLARFLNAADNCVIWNSNLARQRGGAGVAIDFDSDVTYCKALNCTEAGGLPTTDLASQTGCTVTHDAANIFDKKGLTATGDITFGEIQKMLNAMAHLNFVVSGSDLLFYDDDWVSAGSPGTLLFTVTVGEGTGRTVVDA